MHAAHRAMRPLIRRRGCTFADAPRPLVLLHLSPPPKTHQVADAKGSWVLGLCCSCAINFHERLGLTTAPTYRRCQSCCKFAVFGQQGGRARSCAVHRANGDVDVAHRKCSHKGCPKIPTYGKVGEKSPTRCKTHMLAGYVSIGKRMCQHPEGCEKWPGYGDAEEGVTRFCFQHKKTSHVDLHNRRCLVEGCETQAAFGLVAEISVRYCKRHKADHHISIKTRNVRCKALHHCPG